MFMIVIFYPIFFWEGRALRDLLRLNDRWAKILGSVYSTALVAAFLHRIGFEEKGLENKFGEGYRKYKKESRSLIPYIY